MSKGQKLYKKAKKIIPGGNQLLSKRPEMFLPNLWPSYYKKSKGIEIIINEYNSNDIHIKMGYVRLFFLFIAFLLKRISNKE